MNLLHKAVKVDCVLRLGSSSRLTSSGGCPAVQEIKGSVITGYAVTVEVQL
jgi:hypothetical protein